MKTHSWKRNKFDRNLWSLREPASPGFTTVAMVEKVGRHFWPHKAEGGITGIGHHSLRAAQTAVETKLGLRAPRKAAFFFHYNKPASLAAKANRLTFHWHGVCHLVHGIKCQVPIETRNRKSQPRCVMAGRATNVWFENDIATIV